MTELVELPARPVLSIRTTFPVARLGEMVGDRLATLSRHLRDHGLRPAGPPFVRYHTFGDVQTDMEFGVPLTAPAEPAGDIAAGELPAGPAATTYHDGPHIELGKAYREIAAWCAAHNRTPAGPAWETYHWIDLAAPSPRASAASGRTQLTQPLAPA